MDGSVLGADKEGHMSFRPDVPPPQLDLEGPHAVNTRTVESLQSVFCRVGPEDGQGGYLLVGCRRQSALAFETAIDY